MFIYLPQEDSSGFGDNRNGPRLGDFGRTARLVPLYNQRMTFILPNQIRPRQRPLFLGAQTAEQGKQYHVPEITIALLKQFYQLFVCEPFGQGRIVGQPRIMGEVVDLKKYCILTGIV